MKDAAGDWFREIISVLFGSMVGDIRMVGELFLMVAKKSSKTTYSAALMILALLMNKRPRAEFLFLGPTRIIADLAFEQAAGMIDADESGWLQRRFHVQGHLKQITDRRNKSQLLIKSFDAGVLTGVKPAGVLIDELHEISHNPAASRIVGQIRGGLLPNPEAFLIFITTQSDQVPAGVFKAELATARAIRDGKMTGRMLPLLYEFPPDIAAPPSGHGAAPPWYNPDLWWMVTPNRGRSITIERLVEDFNTERTKSNADIARWASQHLNIEIGQALFANSWAGADFWLEQGDPDLTLEELIDLSEVITIGIDGGGLDDLLAVAVIGRDAVTKNWLCWCRCWAHPIALERRKQIVPELLDFADAGDLVVVDQIGQDVDEIALLCKQVHASGKLHSVGLDRAGIGAVVDALASVDITVEAGLVVGVGQGVLLAGAVKTTERKLAEGTFIHAAQPVVGWAAGNAMVEIRGNAVLVTKQASGTTKIDPIMAIFDAVHLMSENPSPPAPAPTFQMFFSRAPDRRRPDRRPPNQAATVL